MWVDGHVPSENLTDSVWFSFPALGAEHPRGPVALASCGRCCIPLQGSTCVGWKSFEGLEILGMGPQVGPTAPPCPGGNSSGNHQGLLCSPGLGLSMPSNFPGVCVLVWRDWLLTSSPLSMYYCWSLVRRMVCRRLAKAFK